MSDAGHQLEAPQPAVEQPAPESAPARPRISRVTAAVQPKLVVGAAGDPSEREADRMADWVVRSIRHPAPPSGVPVTRAGRVQAYPAAVRDIHRCSPGCGHIPEPAVPAPFPTAPRIRRFSVPSPMRTSHRCGPGCIHRHAGHDHGHDHDHDHDHGAPEVGLDGGELPADLTRSITAASGRGASIEPGLRGSLESAFGADFSGVRVHTDSDVAPRIGASAFTAGSDIHFAAGQYRPTSRDGQWLLSHELTHVVQQGNAGVHRHWRGSCILRHASKEHYMLGSMTPAQIKSVGEAKGKVDSAVAQNTGFLSLFSSPKLPPKEQLQEALTSIQEQLVGLDNWRTATVDQPAPDAVDKGGTAYDHYWGGQLVTVQCRDGELVCTVGELNAIPDFFGSYDDLALVDRSIVFKTLQVIRRESYMYLKGLEAQLQGKTYAYNAKTEGFQGIEGNKISIAGIGPKATDDLGDLWETEKMLKGGNGEVGLDDSIGASATLGRNACHFPPESWLRWRAYHQQARTLIASATDENQLNVNANKAIGLNAFGEHYLQDSFASGHLINKSFVMAVAMEHLSAATKQYRGVTDEHIQELQTATAHSEAYALPQAAQEKINARKGNQPEPQNALDDQSLRARDPQSALEAGKALQGIGTQDQGKDAEMAGLGLTPGSMTFEQYRAWLNDTWLQKITNTLHDKYCVNGLQVMSPDNPNLFKIYGDSNMMRSSEGAEYTAQTSLMSRSAINALVDNKRAQLAAQAANTPVQQPKPVFGIDEIVARFPNQVKDDDGTVMPLETWATGQPMRKKIASVVASISGDFVTGFIRAVSPFKPVSSGLDPSHGPF